MNDDEFKRYIIVELHKIDERLSYLEGCMAILKWLSTFTLGMCISIIFTIVKMNGG